MVKTLIKHGNSYALIVDRPILELLKISPESPLELSTDGTCLVIRLAKGRQRHVRVAAALGRVNARHGKALKRLAK